MTPRDTFRILLGLTIAHLRKQTGLSQGDLASRANLPQSTYSRMERGYALLEWYDLECILRGLQHGHIRTVGELLDFTTRIHRQIDSLVPTLDLAGETDLTEEQFGALFSVASLSVLSAKASTA